MGLTLNRTDVDAAAGGDVLATVNPNASTEGLVGLRCASGVCEDVRGVGAAQV